MSLRSKVIIVGKLRT